MKESDFVLYLIQISVKIDSPRGQGGGLYERNCIRVSKFNVLRK